MDAISNRLKEPSTYAGIAVLLGFVGVHLTPEAWSGLVNLGGAAVAVIAMIVPEKGA